MTALGGTLGSNGYHALRDEAQGKVDDADQQIADADKKIADADKKIADAEDQIADGAKRIADGEKELADAQVQLEDGKDQLANAESQLTSGQRQIDDARYTAQTEREKAEAQLAGARAKLDEAQQQYDESAAQYESARSAYDEVTSRFNKVSGNYDALVAAYDAIEKQAAAGQPEESEANLENAISEYRDALASYEEASAEPEGAGVAVLAGTLLAGFLAVLVVEGIMNPASADPFTLPTFPPYFNLPQLLMGGGIEMVLILLSTWLAAHGLLKRNAVELLSGAQTASAKEHFWERTKLWKGMSLFSQTVVNNCINDTRRVFATLIGVAGCTALIVCAVTLSMNVSASIKRHYEAVYDFDTLVYLDTDVDGAAEKVGAKLDELGLASAPVHVEKLQVRQPNGYRSSASLSVPTDAAAFAERYHLLPTSGDDADLSEEGIWISAAYADHMNVSEGETVRVTEGTGQTHEFPVAGIFEYHVLRNEFVLSRADYRTSFGSEPEANVLMVERGDAEVDELREEQLSCEGYDTLVDDYTDSRYAFDELANLLDTVVLVYLLLSALMAIVVLLSLDIMFVDEKKRELIVLMINGFSVSDAKAYIYRDSIALTVVGIVAGVLFGTLMGSITVGALEPSYGSFIRSFNPIAALVGIVGAGIFSAVVLLYALRKIPRFDLTDINRF